MKKTLVAAVLLILWLAIPSPVSAENETPATPITLTEAIRLALKENLDLRTELTNPELMAESLRKSRSIFVPVLSASGTMSESNSPSSSAIEGAAQNSTNRQMFNLGVSQRLITGGTVSAAVDLSRNKSSSRFSSFNPSLNSQLKLSLNQPLLKNLGSLPTRHAILLARINQDKALIALKSTVIGLVYQVETAYWNLVHATRSVEVTRKSLELARDLLRQNELQVKVGVSAPMDILTAKAEVASRESELIQAESNVQTTAENLRRILNFRSSDRVLAPGDAPSFASMDSDFNALLERALANRPEIASAKADLKAKDIDVRYYRNQLRPDLALTAAYYTTGLSGDQLLVEGNVFDQNAKIIGVIPGKLWDALKDSLENKYRNFSVGLSLNLPLSNTSARADLAIARIQMERSLLVLKNAEATVYSDVKQVVIDVEKARKSIDATRLARELAEEKLAAEQKKLSVGLSTNYLVLQFQRDFSTAQISELKALIDYNLATSRVHQVTGDTLEYQQVDLEQLVSR